MAGSSGQRGLSLVAWAWTMLVSSASLAGGLSFFFLTEGDLGFPIRAFSLLAIAAAGSVLLLLAPKVLGFIFTRLVRS